MKKNTQHQRYKDYKQRKENAKHKKENSIITTFSIMKELFKTKREFIKMPKEVVHIIIKDKILNFVELLLVNGLAFSYQLGYFLAEQNLIIIAMFFIFIYAGSGAIRSSFNSSTNKIRNLWSEQKDISIEERNIEMLLITKNKVFDGKVKLSAEEIDTSISKFMNSYWGFYSMVIELILEGFFAIFSIIGFFYYSIGNIEYPILFITSMIIVSIFSFICNKKSLDNNNSKRNKQDKINNKKKEILAYNKIAVILNLMHVKYLKNNYLNILREKMNFEENYSKTKRNIDLLNEFVELMSILVVFVFYILFNVGKTDYIRIIINLISLISIYSRAMGQVDSCIKIGMSFRENVDALIQYRRNFDMIYQTYEKEIKIEKNKLSNVEYIDIPEMKLVYNSSKEEKSYILNIPSKIRIYKGESVLFDGPTGSGKSTILNMLTGNEYFDGYIPKVKSMILPAESKLGINNIFSELTFGDENFNKEKLIRILKGLHLYEEFYKKEDNVLQLLSKINVSELSAGQGQRLTIARLLYNIEDECLIAFDESTSHISGEAFDQTMTTIKEECKDKILLFASHQIKEIEKYIDRRIVIREVKDGFEAVEECCEEAEDLVA